MESAAVEAHAWHSILASRGSPMQSSRPSVSPRPVAAPSRVHPAEAAFNKVRILTAVIAVLLVAASFGLGVLLDRVEATPWRAVPYPNLPNDEYLNENQTKVPDCWALSKDEHHNL